MNSKRKDLGNEGQNTQPDPTTPDLSDADISLLIEFFQTLDEWDRQSKLTPSAESKGSSHDLPPVSG